MKTSKLVNLLQEAREAYYNKDSPLMNDAEFDALEDELRSIDPNHEYFSHIGYAAIEAETSSKIQHKVPMLSMGKAKSLQEVEKWLRRLDPHPSWALAIQPKIDGLSATLIYVNNRLTSVATRGDGSVGQDITHVAEYIKDIPKKITFTSDPVEIRGELHLPKDTGYNTDNRPLRNNCVGLINRKTHREDLQYVRFLAYQIIWPQSSSKQSGAAAAPQHISSMDQRFNSEFAKLDILTESGFYTFEKWLLTPDIKLMDTDSHMESIIRQLENIYNNYIINLRDKWNYETDGLIILVDNNLLHESIDNRWIVSHHHHYALAFKPPSESTVTTLIDIIWQVSRQGSITPVAQFRPVFLGGATLERASLHNADNVRKLRLSVGDSILVERANDVIPCIRGNPDASSRPEGFQDPELWPENCPSCGAKPVESGVNIICPDPECRDRVLQSILYWVRQNDMEQIALHTLELLYDSGKLRSVKDLYTLTEEDFKDLEGFGQKRTENFLKQTARRKTMTPIEFIGRLSIPMVQEKSLSRLGITSIEDFMNFNDETYTIGKRIIEWKNVERNMTMVQELLEIIEIQESSFSIQAKAALCLTGKAPVPRKVLISALEKNGWEVTGTVTKNTVKVICNDPNATSAKLEKARANRIQIISYDEFLSREGIVFDEKSVSES